MGDGIKLGRAARRAMDTAEARRRGETAERLLRQGLETLLDIEAHPAEWAGRFARVELLATLAFMADHIVDDLEPRRDLLHADGKLLRAWRSATKAINALLIEERRCTLRGDRQTGEEFYAAECDLYGGLLPMMLDILQYFTTEEGAWRRLELGRKWQDWVPQGARDALAETTRRKAVRDLERVSSQARAAGLGAVVDEVLAAAGRTGGK